MRFGADWLAPMRRRCPELGRNPDTLLSRRERFAWFDWDSTELLRTTLAPLKGFDDCKRDARGDRMRAGFAASVIHCDADGHDTLDFV